MREAGRLVICSSCQCEHDGPGEVCPSCVQKGTTASVYVGTVIGSRYELQMPLGRGGMGIVFKAHDRVLDETVALKLLRADVAGSADVARRFRSEIKLARKVRHPNVCAIHEYGEEGGLNYISMEFVDGTDVKRLLRDGAFPAPKALDVALQAAAGLQAIHDVGVIHRDLKSSNVMLDGTGRVLLMDFGIAKQLGSDATLSGTVAGMVVGTPEYMSPEQARAETVDFRSDIYALGIMVFELLTGHVPFHGETPIATIFKHLQEPPPLDGPLARSIPLNVVPVLSVALAKEPSQRYDSARAMGEALGQARAALGATSIPQPSAAPTAVSALTAVGSSLEATRIETPPTPTSVTPPTLLTPEPTWKNENRGGVAQTREPISAGKLLAFVFGTAVLLLAVVGGVLWQRLSSGRGPVDITPGNVSSPFRSSPATSDAPGPSEAEIPDPRTPPLSTEEEKPVSPGPVTGPTPDPITLPTPDSVVPTPSSASPRPRTSSRTPRQSATAPPAALEAMAGFLRFRVRPWAEISIDGKIVGTTPLKAVRVAPGVHSVRFSHPDYKPILRKVTIASGKTLKMELDLAWEAVPRRPLGSVQE